MSITKQKMGRRRLPDRIHRLHSVGELDDRQCRNDLRAERPVPDPGGFWTRGPQRRADDRPCAGAAGSGAAASWQALGAGAIFAGAALSAQIAPAELVLASTAAFLLSELADFAVYTPLQAKRLILAVVASSAVGLVIDSVVFLYLAFGSLDFLAGQVVGKALMVALAVPFIWWLRERDKKLGMALPKRRCASNLGRHSPSGR